MATLNIASFSNKSLSQPFWATLYSILVIVTGYRSMDRVRFETNSNLAVLSVARA